METQARVLAMMREFLEAAAALPPGGVTLETPLLDGGVLDSLGILQLTTAIEEKFGVPVADEDFVPQNFETVGSLVRYLGARLPR